MDTTFTPLSDVELRVLGALLEKEYATPDGYPMSLNAVVLACNQTTSREPVTSLEDSVVSATLDRLKHRGLVRSVIHSGGRVTKYAQAFGEALGLVRRQLAVLDIMMLRGPQTVNELRTRTQRLYEFADVEDVESTLEGLASRAPMPLVRRLERRSGEREPRWAHLLGGEPAAGEEISLADAPRSARPPAQAPADGRLEALEREVTTLRQELQELRDAVTALGGSAESGAAR